MRSRFGNRLRYVFRHRPLTGSVIARQAAELVESFDDPARFWNIHVSLIARSDKLTEDDLRTIAADLDEERDTGQDELALRAKVRVDADIESAAASGVIITPTFFINDRRYDGPWDAN